MHKSVSYIHLAVEKARPRLVELLLSNHANVNLLDNEKNTPAHYVTDVSTLRILINYGARLDKVNNLGETPIKTAQTEKRNSVYHYLILHYDILRTRPQQYFNHRFAGYYRNHVLQGMEAKYFTHSPDSSLELLGIDQPTNLFEDLPDLEEAPTQSSIQSVYHNPRKREPSLLF